MILSQYSSIMLGISRHEIRYDGQIGDLS